MGILYYGDNLDVMKRHISDQSVDLVYLDPPFNSNQNYNVLFKEQDGAKAASQILAFEDTWTWDSEDVAVYQELVMRPGKLSELLQGFYTFLGPCNLMAYVVMMAPRLVELKRVMKDTASIYLHCDTTASHYLKLLMDAVFGKENYRNEIVWLRSNPKSHISINFPCCTDIILRYSKTHQCIFYPQYGQHDDEYIKNAYKYHDDKGQYRFLPLLNPNDDRPNLKYEFLGITRVWRWSKDRMEKAYKDGIVVQLKPGSVPQYKKYLHDSKGKTVTNCWTDIKQSAGNESLGYPTQKPITLLERIINASSNEGDTVLDPFCGCGTTIAAAQKLKRKWIGIDITHIAVTLMKHRLKDMYNLEPFGKKNPDGYRVIGEPVSVQDAQALADADKYQFQYWALGLVGARPEKQDEKKGADKGIDGKIIFFEEILANKIQTVVISVKGGNANVAHVRDLRGVVEREKAAIGVLITMQEPTSPMMQEAASAGFYESVTWGKKYPKIQILTIRELMDQDAPKTVLMPPTKATFQKAQRVVMDAHQQLKL